MPLNAQPPYGHSVRLKGTLVKMVRSQGGCRCSLHHGTEVYKVFMPDKVQPVDSVEELEGGYVEVWAHKNRKLGGWEARTGFIRGTQPS